MAFYLVVDGKRNEFGEADSYVVRASGTRQAAKLAPLVDRKGAEVTKLDDGRDVPNGVILSSLVDSFEDAAEALPFGEPVAEVIETENTETVQVSPAVVVDAPRYSVI
ncbi:hypothetical protein CPT_Shady_029 [Streptomyces phage Shady]|uniref:Uncharacterized protein n=1 Tax=Streptomyces phage Shady TaxID=2767585 RepID=A0A873WEE7_9CAUD|nr:hypothetical protein CPT_Shady_029 [Streptomyces phage Shady]